MQQLNKNEFALRGMIAADRQQIDGLKAQVARQNDQIEELQHNTTPAAGPSSRPQDPSATPSAARNAGAPPRSPRSRPTPTPGPPAVTAATPSRSAATP